MTAGRFAIAFAFLLACDSHGHSPSAAPSSSQQGSAPPSSAPSAATSLPSATAAASAAADPTISQRGIRWGLGCAPVTLTMKTRKDFRITIKATNVGKEMADTGRHQMSFSTGVEGGGRTLNLAFGNGHRAKEWSALPPGETVEESRDMGESILPKPGDYTIRIDADGGTASCTVHVE